MSWFDRAYRFVFARGVARYPVTRIADASHGAIVRVFGRIHADELLAAPISQRACVAWVVSIEIEGFSRPIPVAESMADAVPFWIEDESALAWVEPVSTARSLPLAVSLTEYAAQKLSKPARELLESARVQTEHERVALVREAVVLPRANVTVVGRLESIKRRDGGSGYRGDPRPGERHLRIVGDVIVSNRSELF